MHYCDAMSQTFDLDQPVTSLPYADRRNRLILDTLRFNAEGAQAAFLRVSRLLETINDREPTAAGPDISNEELSILFSDAWTVVRSCHSIFEVIRKEKFAQIHVPSNDLELGSMISKARNGMDHIAGNIGNYAKKTKDTMPPLLGVITACFVPKCEKGASVEELKAIVVSHSDFHHAIDLEVFPPDEKMFPISGWMSHIRLHAFTVIVELSQVAEFLNRLISELNCKYSGEKQSRLNVVVSMRGQEPFEVEWR